MNRLLNKGTFVLAALVTALVAVGVQAAPSAPAAPPRNDDWIVIGPGGGGTMYIPTVSPHDPNRVVVRCDMTGGYITNDMGESWRMSNIHGTIRFFVFDPVEKDTLYAWSNGLFRTKDGAETWELVFPDPGDITGLIMPDDHAGVIFRTKSRKITQMTALAVDPADSKVLYASMLEPWGKETRSRLMISKDAGKTWAEAAALPAAAALILADPKSPKDNCTLYVICGAQVGVFEGGKLSLRDGPEGVEEFSFVSGGFDSKTGKPVIYGTRFSWRASQGPSGIFVTRDAGENWENVTGGVKTEWEGAATGAGAVACALNHGEAAYMSCYVFRERERLFRGVAKTADAGKTWELVEEESYKSNPKDELAWYYPLYSYGWRVAPRELGVDPNNPDTVYGTDTGRTIRSTDGGKNWFPCFSKILDDGSVTTRGLDVTTCYGYHFDPFDPKRHFISYTDIGLFRSEDGGTTWIISTENIPRPWRNTTYWVEFDPEVEGLMWGAFGRNHDLPRPKMWRRRDPGDYQGGVAVSTDGGRSWELSNEGMPETATTHVLIDPASPVGNRTLYACGYGTGVWKSVDNGKTWALKNKGVVGEQPFAWRITRDKDGALYLVVARKYDDNISEYGTDLDGALYRSTDGAETWERITLPEGVNGPNGLTVDPEDPKRLYLSCWGRWTKNGAVNGGILLSEDAGRTWREALTRDQHIYDVTVDPNDTRVLYTCGFEHNAWRSEDRGKTWKRIKGYNFKWGHRVVPDPEDPEMIYITTFGGSVWYGPAKGDPDAVEDIVTPVVSYDASTD
ncbi:MAG: WD40/YVTN/BNR-like repeat-containing protein [Planctomycetota bacterium]|jgi:photosystem II stability/assembly factor-like uncharacterized protein